MTDQPDNIVLVYLRRIDEKVDRMVDDIRKIKSRLGTLEAGYASLSIRLDRLDDRVQRIERRLDLAPAPSP